MKPSLASRKNNGAEKEKEEVEKGWASRPRRATVRNGLENEKTAWRIVTTPGKSRRMRACANTRQTARPAHDHYEELSYANMRKRAAHVTPPVAHTHHALRKQCCNHCA